MNAKTGFDMVLPLEVKTNFEEGLNRRVKERYNEAEVLNKMNRKPGDVTYIERRIGIPEGNEMIYKSSYLFVPTISDNKDLKQRRNDVYTALCKLKDRTEGIGRKNIAHPLLDQQSEDETRNVLEYVFRESGHRLNCIVKNKKSGEGHT